MANGIINGTDEDLRFACARLPQKKAVFLPGGVRGVRMVVLGQKRLAAGKGGGDVCKYGGLMR